MKPEKTGTTTFISFWQSCPVWASFSFIFVPDPRAVHAQFMLGVNDVMSENMETIPECHALCLQHFTWRLMSRQHKVPR